MLTGFSRPSPAIGPVAVLSVAVLIAPSVLAAQDPALDRARTAAVVDMHLHAFSADQMGPPPQSICSPFRTFGWADPADGYAERHQQCVGRPLLSPETDDELIRLTVEALERHDMVGVASGPPEMVKRYKQAAPDRIIPALLFAVGMAPPPDTLRRLFEDGGFMVFGEMITQYEGYGPDAPELEPYFAMAEELDVPVGIHVGFGPAGIVYGPMPGMRYRYGDPLLLEDVLVRHPRLRLYVMHAGYPMVDRMIALLHAYPQVYVDISVLPFVLQPRVFHAYLQRLIDAGYEDRIMYGSDQMVWPESIGRTIAAVREADFLTHEQERAILRGNALRFLRIEPGD